LEKPKYDDSDLITGFGAGPQATPACASGDFGAVMIRQLSGNAYEDLQTRSIQILLSVVLSSSVAFGQPFQPSIPKVWDDREIAEFELPNPAPHATPKHITSAYYYRIPPLVIYKTYSRQPPAGMTEEKYVEWLNQQEPEIVFDRSKLRTEADWIKAGEMVFRAGARFSPNRRGSLLPYVIRRRGELEIPGHACSNCHTGTLPDGTRFFGGPPKLPPSFVPRPDLNLNAGFTAISPESALRRGIRRQFGTPWFNPDPNEYSPILFSIRPVGNIIPRSGTSWRSPQPIPDLIGIKDHKYLDHTGLERHRNIADFMRYAALNINAAAIQELGNYAGFIPAGIEFKTLPDPDTLVRYSDEQLYAMALYVYSLKPPPNPNTFDELAQRGKKIFTEEGCPVCHTAPLYTNNKLIPAPGFVVPKEHLKKYDVLPVVVGTDPYLTMKTRRGTGYYKVPSLRGVWYRGPFEHNGSVATLEDWFDPKRLREDYEPSGWAGPSKTRAVKGHEFGLKLSEDDKKALIAFLKTL
jgi:hypothetical protein